MVAASHEMKRVVLALLVACRQEPAPAPVAPLDVPPLPPRPTPAPRPMPAPVTDFGLPEGCHGKHLTTTGSMAQCGCHETMHYDGGGVRADLWCGPPRPLERTPPILSVALAPPNVGPGEPFRVVLRVENPSPTEPALYRLRGQEFFAKIVKTDGGPLPRSVFASAPARDEALFELDGGGTLTVTLDLRAEHAQWNAANRIETRPLPRGSYHVEVSRNGLGSGDDAVAPLEVH